MTFEFVTPVGKIILFQSHLPLEPLVTKVEFFWYAEKHMWSIFHIFVSLIFLLLLLFLITFKALIVWYVVGNWIAQWKNDIAVWENKIFKYGFLSLLFQLLLLFFIYFLLGYLEQSHC